MNWTFIKETCPKAEKQWEQFKTAFPGTTLFQFFDIKKLIIGIEPRNGGFAAVLNKGDIARMSTIWIDNHFPDRKSAETRAFEKAFQELETKLNNEQN